jgi:ComF family protein
MELSRFIDVVLPPTRVAGEAAVRAEGFVADEPGSYCGRCGATADRTAMTLEGCSVCRGQRLPWSGVWRLSAYRQPVSRWVVEMKFQRAWQWGEWFGRQLAEATSRVRIDGPEVVTSVPLHWRRRWSRGYDQSLLIARAFADAKGVPLAPLLIRRRYTQPQSDLHSHHARLKNVRQAFSPRRVSLAGMTVWLIDDVKTSGSTLRQCSRLLRAMGAERVNLSVIAVADPKQPVKPAHFD